LKADSERIVITGIGVVSPIGIGRDAYWQGLKEGRSGIKPVTLFDTSNTRSKLAGEITDFNPEEILGEKGLRNLDRTTKLALCAAKLAIDDAKFEINEKNTHQIGVVLGSTMGSIRSISEFDKEALTNGPRSVNPALFPNTVINSPASQISIRFGIKGFNTTISTGFTSSIEALEYASNFIRLGRAQAVLVGGVEELCEQVFKGFYKLGFLAGSKKINSSEISSPFDRRRNGAILGEGSSIFMIESLKSALARGATIYGEILSTASAFDRDGYQRYNPKGEGLKKALVRALKFSQTDPSQIQYVASGGNSSLDGDCAEARALTAILGNRKGRLMVSASKSMIGETFSAGGAFQLAAGLMTLSDRVVHPTINFLDKDRRCEIDCVPNLAREEDVDNALVSCGSPTGSNSVLMLARYSG